MFVKTSSDLSIVGTMVEEIEILLRAKLILFLVQRMNCKISESSKLSKDLSLRLYTII